ncbi:MAG: hypothetical protein M3544_06690 [Pseudomonadota bacterium]|nr:hypothetical protein [Pseudomonadota bacterium]
MHPAIQGLLVGLGVAVFLLGAEYFLLKKNRDDRAKRLKRTQSFDQTERGRIATMLRFCILVPLGFAAAFWVIWG